MKYVYITIVTFFALSGLTTLLPACVTHYIPATCPMIEPPPVMSKVDCFRICFVKPDGTKVGCYIAIREGDSIKLQTNEKMKSEYMQRCFDLIGDQPK